VLDAHLIRSAIEAGIQRYDFLGGDHAYKRRWGAEQQPYLFLRCARPRSAGGLFIQLGRWQLTRTIGRKMLKLLKARPAK
jgi:CelD/BcsL family acetyltransferase involved in cellulose biosynthesis